MFRFAQPIYFYLLLLMPIMTMLYILYIRKHRRNVKKYAQPDLFFKLAPYASYKKKWIKFLLLSFAYFLLVVALARPQLGSKIKEVKSNGVEIVVALDVSNSMLADDLKPDRLSTAKLALTRLLNKLKDDRLGLVVFAGDAYTQLPITSDFASAKMFFNSINPNIVPQQGTALGKAIIMGTKSFSSDSKNSRVLIVISDGENHEDDPIAAAKEAERNGVRIYTVGVGQPQGVPIPTPQGFMKDREGNIVVTKLDETTLQQVAEATGGKYIKATESNFGLNNILDDIHKIDKIEMKSFVYEEYDEKYQTILIFALIVLLCDMLIIQKKSIFAPRLDIFRRK